MSNTLHADFLREVAEDIYTYVINEQLEAGERQEITPDFGLCKDWWIDATIDVEARVRFDKGDRWTPDNVDVRYTGIYLRGNASIVDDGGETIDLDRFEIRQINKTLKQLCA